MMTFIQAGLVTVILIELYIIHQNLTAKQAHDTESRLNWIAGIVSRSIQTGKARKSFGKKRIGGFRNISSTIKRANNFSLPKGK